MTFFTCINLSIDFMPIAQVKQLPNTYSTSEINFRPFIWIAYQLSKYVRAHENGGCLNKVTLIPKQAVPNLFSTHGPVLCTTLFHRGISHQLDHPTYGWRKTPETLESSSFCPVYSVTLFWFSSLQKTPLHKDGTVEMESSAFSVLVKIHGYSALILIQNAGRFEGDTNNFKKNPLHTITSAISSYRSSSSKEMLDAVTMFTDGSQIHSFPLQSNSKKKHVFKIIFARLWA